MIEIRGFSIGNFKSETKFDLTIDDGEILGIIGAEGSGKTSMLKSIAGLCTYAGSILIGNSELSEIDKSVKNKIISHNIYLCAKNPDESLENFLILSRLPFKGRFSPFSEYDRDARERYSAELGLSPFMQTPIGMLSSSPLKKALICFAMIREAQILLLDEPASGLDLLSSKNLARSLSRYTSAGSRSVLIASNDINFVLQSADRIAVMKGGAVSHVSKPEEINAEHIKKYFGVDSLITRNVYNGRPAVHYFSEN